MRFLALNVATLAGAGAAFGLAFEEWRLPAVAGVGLLWSAALTWGVAHPRSSLFLPVHSRGRDRTKVALTFDDGPGEATRPIVATLRELGARATFFVVGENVKGREDVLRSIASAGHAIGTHTFSHSRLTNFLLARAMTEEIRRGQDAVAQVIGKRPRLYRPPVGLKSPSVGAAVRALDLVCVGWSRRALDGGAGPHDPARIVARLVGARGGEVLLLHDGVEPGRKGDRSGTIKALREVVPLLRARGLELVTVDQLLGVEAYAK